jgi:uncharacterized membrane protein
MLRKVVVVSLAAILLTLCGASDAHAWFRFTNRTSEMVQVTFQWSSPNCPDGGGWETKGWWILAPGETKTVFGVDLQTVGRHYYYYAESITRKTWSGPFQTCTPHPAFDWCLNTCNNAPETRILGYREIYIGSYNNYTLTLIP